MTESRKINDWKMYSFMDGNSFELPSEILTGGLDNIREFSKDFLRQEQRAKTPNSEVWIVKDKRTQEIVALKHVESRHLKTSLPREIFREITTLKNLNHEHVVKLLNVFMDPNPDRLMITFEKCDLDLAQYIDKHQGGMMVKHDQVKVIGVQLFRGLNYIHKNYIVHRDIKPQNLLISPKGQLKIADFGISRRFSSLDKPSTPGAMTLYYQAPEILFESPRYNEKVDVWSAGCVIVELMTKKPLFECRSQLDLIKKVCQVLGRPTPKNWPGLMSCVAAKRVNMPDNMYNKLEDYLLSLKCTIAFPFLSGIFVYDPDIRASAAACVRHEWFEQAPFPAPKIELPTRDPFAR